jgi:hypothetical protein
MVIVFKVFMGFWGSDFGSKWDFNPDGSAFTGYGFDAKAAADHLDAFFHAEQVEADCFDGARLPLDLKVNSIIGDFHEDAAARSSMLTSA